MTIKLHPFVLIALLLGIVIILFLLVRGCKHSENKDIENIVLKEALDSIALKNERDSMAAVQHEKYYADSLQFVNGELSLQIVKREATEEKLLATTNNAAFWKQKYQSVKPDNDTSVTMVPNEFIADAHDCFDEVEKKNQLIKRYVRENHEIDSTNRIKERIQTNRIRQLGQERDAANLNLNECLTTAKRQLEISKPRRKVFVSLGLIGERDYLIMGLGAGGFYMDKKEKMFGGNIYGTNRGPYVTANIMMPLSFKRKP